MRRQVPKILIAASSALVLACVGVISSAQASQPNVAAKAQPAKSFLFSLTGAVAAMQLIPGSGDRYAFVMKKTDENTIWFADRPYRESGVEPTALFVHGWNSMGFTKNPPNISIVLHKGVGKTSSIVAVMRNPSFDQATNTLRATMQVLSQEKAGALTGQLGKRANAYDAANPPMLMGAVSLFIDNVNSPSMEYYYKCMNTLTNVMVTPPGSIVSSTPLNMSSPFFYECTHPDPLPPLGEASYYEPVMQNNPYVPYP